MNDDNSCRAKPFRKYKHRSKSSYRSAVADDTLDFPFLKDNETKRHIQCSKIMIILRGLPGSGKSFLADKVKQKYGNNSIICSADKFFESNGEYVFDRDKLHIAHEVCQKKAKQACRNGINLIVVDNCNVCEWEMEFYLQLATDNGYVQLVVEPKSSWKFTVEILAAKNIHGLKKQVLQRKLSQWEHLHPMYFAWFINERDSASLQSSAISCISQCLRINEFSKQMSSYMKNPYTDFCQYFNLNHGQPCGLHCTAAYFGPRKRNEARRYEEELVVSKEYGKVSKLCIVGYIVSPHSFGACVNLTAHQLQIWRQDKTIASGNSRAVASGKNLHWDDELVQALSSLVVNSDTKQSVQCSSHITLGNKEGFKPKQTGIDLGTALNLEFQSQVNRQRVPTFKYGAGWAKKYGSYWVISLDNAQTVNAIFASCF